jgi:hypothetical protein
VAKRLSVGNRVAGSSFAKGILTRSKSTFRFHVPSYCCA